ncbi:MAG: hypothetical protein CO094_12360 [Anaerolineae bacterium CG_4_9_14_3_um_filter_57_17]|nr:hypothetical protein [bacterium]NCT19817.1 hypothetical protein [bacterium]OIO84967.1 MAG: hypothetical protein AUK01_07605 [Anaerolineae bacterium CG2_30_57_67]PJB64641.1 MAG: hypothetical protein CO094_12360 [Anaerolineae bacterium CG_4_9_14_3_um_filter_57_17]
MKMLIAIVYDDNVDALIQALTADSFRVTRVASTGGFFHKGNTTLLIGVDDERIDAAMNVLRQKISPAVDDEKRATVFVVPVSRFEQI